MRWITTGRNELRGQLHQVLGSLGDDAAQIARRLDDAGVRGTPRDPRDCALAVYLSALVGVDPFVRSLKVTTDRVIISRSRRYRPPITLTLPAPLRSFVSGFDRECYPQLTRAQQEPSNHSESAMPNGSL